MKHSRLVWLGWALTGLFALFMAGASIAPKLMGMAVAKDTLKGLGWDPGFVWPIGLIELGCLALYLAPRTNVLGAVLFTALFGGAMATQIRAESPLFSHVLFSLYLGLMMWGGLWLRDPRLRALFPVRRDA